MSDCSDLRHATPARLSNGGLPIWSSVLLLACAVLTTPAAAQVAASDGGVKFNFEIGGNSNVKQDSANPDRAQGSATKPIELDKATVDLPALPQPTLNLPTLNTYASPESPENRALAKTSELDLRARLTDGGSDIPTGLVWRVFTPDVGPDGELPLVASAQGGNAIFNLPEGSYLIHVAYGRAGATKRIVLGNAARHELMMLDAGGLKLSAVLPDGGTIKDDLLRFSIYADEDNNERSLIVPDVKPNAIVRLNSGTYHVVSNYGSANATIRADIRVEAGKLTEATVQHRAAEITLKLVREHGGEALADTSWSVLNASGDVVRESVGAYSSLVLIEGDYVAVAKNKDRIYQRDFKVSSGKNEDVEVLTSKEFEASDDTVD